MDLSNYVLDETSHSIAERYVDLEIIKPMSVTERMNVPAPTQASNRTIYDRCLAWGCKQVRSNGNWAWMQTPFGPRFKIRPPQQHEANGREVIENMLENLYLPWAYFIGAEITDLAYLENVAKGFIQREGADVDLPSDEMGPCSICSESVRRAVMVKSGKKIAHKYCVKKQSAPEPAAAPPKEKESESVPETLEVVYTPELDGVQPEPAEEVVTPRQRYINSVFDLLVERGDPMSNRAVAEALGIASAQAGSAMSQLTSLGVVTRVKAGVYQANPQVTRKSGTLGVVLSGGGTLEQEPRPTTRISTAAQPVPMEEPDDTEDETLNELLDLICPGGFKARHLPVIDQFKRCALALMREVNDA